MHPESQGSYGNSDRDDFDESVLDLSYDMLEEHADYGLECKPAATRDWLRHYYEREALPFIKANWQLACQLFYTPLEASQLARDGYSVSQWRYGRFDDDSAYALRLSSFKVVDNEKQALDLDYSHAKITALKDYYPDAQDYKKQFVDLFRANNVGFDVGLYEVSETPQVITSADKRDQCVFSNDCYAVSVPELAAVIVPGISKKVADLLQFDAWDPTNTRYFENVVEDIAENILINKAIVPFLLERTRQAWQVPDPWFMTLNTHEEFYDLNRAVAFKQPKTRNNN